MSGLPVQLGAAFLEACEGRFGGEARTLRAGRAPARKGKFVIDEVAPCQVIGREPDGGEAVADLSVRPLEPDAWNRFDEVVAGRASHVAAVLGGRLPGELLVAAADAGVDVIPSPGDLLTDCSCASWEEPCRHVAMLCHLVATLLDDDPLALLLLRGRERGEFLEAVRALRSGDALGGGAPVDDRAIAPEVERGMSAAEAYARVPGPLPEIPAVRRARRPLPLEVRPPSDAGVDLVGLALLVADAAERAAAVLDDRGAPELADGAGAFRADLARRAAAVEGSSRRPDPTRPEPTDLDGLADRAGVDPDDLRRWSLAWRVGGAPGVEVAVAPPPPDPMTVDAARAVLGVHARISPEGCSADGVQLRRAGDGRWWRFEVDRRLGWTCVAGPFAEPADAADAMG